MALAVMLSGVFFNLCNGLIQGTWIFYFSRYTGSLLTSPSFITGILIFMAGMAINIHSDHIVRNLRKGDSREYRIPYGGMFRFVSAPNYLGEIMEWIGWALLTWSLAGTLFAFWTIANLAPRAKSNHQWYLEKFPDYPDRKILIPGLW